MKTTRIEPGTMMLQTKNGLFYAMRTDASWGLYKPLSRVYGPTEELLVRSYDRLDELLVKETELENE